MLCAVGVLVLAGLATSCQAPVSSNNSSSSAPASTTASSRLERIIVDPSRRGFITADSKVPFHPWGVNYGNAGRLMEDFWQTNWDTVADDFRKVHALGANVVRVHLQVGKFMDGPAAPNQAGLELFARLLRLAETNRFYLDVTGLACYRPSDTPEWYDALDEPARWEAQANFWSAVARVGASSTAVFCYDLINEPLSPGGPRKPGAWASGSLFGDMDFLQFIALDPGKRKREDIPVQWIRRMTSAIRAHDKSALITVGLLPWAKQGGHYSGFVPKKIASELDFISVHIYPESKRPDEAMQGLRHFAVGKPIVIEETFPLRCNATELEKFMRASRAYACGWVGHYDGKNLEDYTALERAGKLTIAQSIYREWVRLFVRLGPEFNR